MLKELKRFVLSWERKNKEEEREEEGERRESAPGIAKSERKQVRQTVCMYVSK